MVAWLDDNYNRTDVGEAFNGPASYNDMIPVAEPGQRQHCFQNIPCNMHQGCRASTMPKPIQTAPIDADRIRDLVPHAGKMCLLERVLDWNNLSIRCETRTHLDTANPLRRNRHLSSLCGIEYAAQAMALHGALNASAVAGSRNQTTASDASQPSTSARPRHGYLASVRDTRCTWRHLDEYTTPLIVKAELVVAESSRVIYSFSVTSGETELITGRAAVVLA